LAANAAHFVLRIFVLTPGRTILQRNRIKASFLFLLRICIPLSFFQSFVTQENQLNRSFRDKSGEDLYAKLKVFKLI